ncbi:Toprim domain-containing protein [Vibrio diazotrophicus]|uniref:Toprim domain-containing protein n=1 Tax=Vibrio diazotrophicus TaxID=685 RepID=A0A329DWL7_VIBDI|nr:AAA family ATPase [Vibrio diazotrophicus]RAS54414.1 Toprim domain-containing protein [Vibrio diazotrophicus]
MTSDHYIQSCIDGICDDIAHCSAGGRNNLFNDKAYRLFQAVGAGQILEQLVVSRLTEVALSAGLAQQEIRDTLKSAKRGITEPKPFGNADGMTISPEIAAKASALQAELDVQSREKQAYSLEQLQNNRNNSAADSPYLARKKLTDAHELFFTGEDNKGAFTAHELFNKSGQSAGFERIYNDGSKRVSAGCGVSGVYYGCFLSGKDDDSVCYITEGAADAVSIMLATGKDCYSATSATNINKVAQLMKPEYQRVIVALDNDKAGRKVAEKLGGEFLCVMPENEGADYSDVYCAGGGSEVNRQLTNKVKPEQLADKTPKNLFKLISGFDGYDTEFSYLIKGYLPMNAFGMVYGASGSFKSFQALSWAAHVAMGKNWNGSKVTQAPVLYVAGEGGIGVPRRIKALADTYNDGYPINDLYRLDHPVAMSDIAEVNQLIESIQHYSEKVNKKFGLVIIDTLARCFGSGDENKTDDMTRFVSACDRLKAQLGMTVLVVHHSGVADKERARGSSSLRAACDFEYRVERVKQDMPALILTSTKAKDDKEKPKQMFTLSNVSLFLQPTYLNSCLT